MFAVDERQVDGERQDVGTRVYTWIWTIALCLEACAQKGIPMLVLDRPNPLGGELPAKAVHAGALTALSDIFAIVVPDQSKVPAWPQQPSIASR